MDIQLVFFNESYPSNPFSDTSGRPGYLSTIQVALGELLLT